MKVIKTLFLTAFAFLAMSVSSSAAVTQFAREAENAISVRIPYAQHQINSDSVVVKAILYNGTQLQNGQFTWRMAAGGSHDITIIFEHMFSGYLYVAGPVDTDTYGANDLAINLFDRQLEEVSQEEVFPAYITVFPDATLENPIIKTLNYNTYDKLIAGTPISIKIPINGVIKVYLRGGYIVIGLPFNESFYLANYNPDLKDIICPETTHCTVEFGLTPNSSQNYVFPENTTPLMVGNVYDGVWIWGESAYQAYLGSKEISQSFKMKNGRTGVSKVKKHTILSMLASKGNKNTVIVNNSLETCWHPDPVRAATGMPDPSNTSSTNVLPAITTTGTWTYEVACDPTRPTGPGHIPEWPAIVNSEFIFASVEPPTISYQIAPIWVPTLPVPPILPAVAESFNSVPSNSVNNTTSVMYYNSGYYSYNSSGYTYVPESFGPINVYGISNFIFNSLPIKSISNICFDNICKDDPVPCVEALTAGTVCPKVTTKPPSNSTRVSAKVPPVSPPLSTVSIYVPSNPPAPVAPDGSCTNGYCPPTPCTYNCPPPAGECRQTTDFCDPYGCNYNRIFCEPPPPTCTQDTNICNPMSCYYNGPMCASKRPVRKN
jgi:hypothetical protein